MNNDSLRVDQKMLQIMKMKSTESVSQGHLEVENQQKYSQSGIKVRGTQNIFNADNINIDNGGELYNKISFSKPMAIESNRSSASKNKS